MEVLRQNQQRMAAPGVNGMKKKMAMVPFRHSKLTEVFQNFFVGDGRAVCPPRYSFFLMLIYLKVMIVNVNPYDTGFDENAHVMRFSAVAREIQTTASNRVTFGLRRQISTQFSALKQAVSGPMKIKVVVPVFPRDTQTGAPVGVASVGPSTIAERESQGFVVVEEELEVVEEDDEGSEDEEERDTLVEHLFEQLREYKTRVSSTLIPPIQTAYAVLAV
jgi:kinesin family protein 20